MTSGWVLKTICGGEEMYFCGMHRIIFDTPGLINYGSPKGPDEYPEALESLCTPRKDHAILFAYEESAQRMATCLDMEYEPCAV